MRDTLIAQLQTRWKEWDVVRRTDRRRARLHVENLEPRALLATVTEYPIPSGAGSALQIITGPDKNLWFTENDPVSNRIGQVTPSGQITEFSVPTAGANPNGITVGPDGDLWFTEQFGDKIGQLTTNGQFAEYPTPSTQQLAGITEGPDGNLWFAVSLGHAIGVLNATSHAVTEYTLPALAEPKNITVGPDGNLWFTDPGTNSVGKITTSGQYTEYSLNSVSIVANPDGIVSDPATKSLWITEDFYGYIAQISTSGTVLNEYQVPGNDPSPSAITIDSSGNIWFSEKGLGTNQIGELNPSTGGFTMYNLPSGATIYGITVGPDGNIWFTDDANKAIGVLNIGGAAGPSSPSPTPTPTPTPTPSPSPSPTPTPSPTSTVPVIKITPIAPGVVTITTSSSSSGVVTPPPAVAPVSLTPAHQRRHHHHRRKPHTVRRRVTRALQGAQVSPAHSTPRDGLTSLVKIEASGSDREH
jgi:streptogramin lyase